MSFYNFLCNFDQPCEVCVTTMETHNTPVYMYYTLVNVNTIRSIPTGNGFTKHNMRLKLKTPTGHMVTMIFEEETNGTDLMVPVHFMCIEDDPTQKRFFFMRV